MNRREFLKTGSALGATLFLPSFMQGATYEKSLRLYHRHTGEWITSTFWIDGEYIYDELESLDYFLRDYRTDEIHKIDIRLIEYLYNIHRLVGYKELHIVSAYRSPKTNMLLRKHNKGVAKNSYHTKGMAADITIPGVRLSTLKYAALSLHRGGVGYYPRSHFIHVDTGRPRYWRYPKR
ncbi:MAG: hypothetical protein C6H99_06535 [Epsilonproteobacteria bacterium]|nr:hypothetical protein [Campylobacterota bacterium]NPA65094.1 YcbK family protein [Campylobacterota bacterium]